MARKHKKSEKRGNLTLPLAKLHSPPLVSPSNRSLILSLEDRREHHPERLYRPARALFKSDALLSPAALPATKRTRRNAQHFAVPFGLSFSVPKRVSLCVRRHQRKEVLFALKKTGKGARARRHRRNWWSNVKC